MLLLRLTHYFKLFFALLIIGTLANILAYILYKQQRYFFSNEIQTLDDIDNRNSNPHSKVKNRFEEIYKKHLWGSYGGGSGVGSAILYTQSVRLILRHAIDELNITSMLDAPCGSFNWMPLLLRNLTKPIRYHGVDVVESLITNAKQKYSNESDWQFSVCDFSAEDLPNGYDLIFSRDALQHLSYEKIVNSLEAYSRVRGAKYLLVGSYFDNFIENINIEIGQEFLINLTKPPFNLNKYIRVYFEQNYIGPRKSLILYDIPNYLRKVDFNKIRIDMSQN